MMILEDKQERNRTFKIEWNELREIICDKIKAVTSDIDPADTITVTIYRETEGSPEYNVDRWHAIVKVCHKIGDMSVTQYHAEHMFLNAYDDEIRKS